LEFSDAPLRLLKINHDDLAQVVSYINSQNEGRYMLIVWSQLVG